MAIRMRRGNEADFDPEKMLPGEWAVSTDTKYVRMCFAPGIVLRMATYEAFESDMEEIRNILLECQSIQTAVELIQNNVTNSELVIENYVKEAKQYRDEAEQYRNETEQYRNETEQFRNEAFSTTSGLIINNTASGDNIHLMDSAKSKVLAFGLYGKAVQKQYTGKNLIPYPYYQSSGLSNGIEFVDNGDGSVTANGVASAHTSFIFNHRIDNSLILSAGTYKISGCPSGGSDSTYRLVVGRTSETTVSFEVVVKEYGDGATFTLTKETDIYIGFEVITGATLSNVVCRPMLRLASITDDTYEPYVGGKPSPSPSYPQEIEVVGASGSIEIKSVGKNLIPYPYYEKSKTYAGITYDVKSNGIIVITGKSTGSYYILRSRTVADENPLILQTGTYYVSGCQQGGGLNTYYTQISKNGANGSNEVITIDYGKGATFTITEETQLQVGIVVSANCPEIITPITFKIMIRPLNIGDDTYEQYKENKVTISTPTGLAGIPVDSEGNYTDENGQQWICDEIVKYADGTGKRIQRIGRTRIEYLSGDGYATSIQGYNISPANFVEKYGVKYAKNNSVKSNMLSSHFIEYTRSGTNGIDTVENGFEINAQGYLVFKSSDLLNLEDWKSWLLENELIIYFVLEEPIETDLTADELKVYENLQTFYPVTNVSNNANCGMSITYVADTKNYIDNKIASLEKALYNNI